MERDYSPYFNIRKQEHTLVLNCKSENLFALIEVREINGPS